MRIINISDKKPLNDFIGSQRGSQFLQSYDWGEFQSAASGKVIRLGAEEGNKLKAVATLIKKPLFFGKSYFYSPRGPVGGAAELFDEVKKIAKREKVIFLRFEPTQNLVNGERLVKTIDVQPSKTLILDLGKTEEELLTAMHQKTRYNLRLAEKKGVKIVAAGPERFTDFWRLMSQTGERDDFRTHGEDYYRKMLECGGEMIKLYFAEYRNKPIATGIFVWFGDTVTYLHGASADHDREVMAPYLLHWQIVKQAKAAGFKNYDLFGIDEKKWPGVTRFKKGFGGLEVKYPGTFDLVFNPVWYVVYKMVRKIRRVF